MSGPRLAVDNAGQFVLADKALLATMNALRFQLAAWEASLTKAVEDGDEDAEVDLRNDMMHLESVLAAFDEEHARRRARPPGA